MIRPVDVAGGSNANSNSSSVKSSQGDRRGPLSIDDLLRQKKETEQAAAKPKFLTKEERAKEAIARRQAQVAGSRSSGLGSRPPPPSSTAPPPPPKRSASEFEADQDASSVPVVDEDLIKQRYLGAHADKKRKRKQSDKKFIFDWDGEDDTGLANEKDPLYRARIEGGPNVRTSIYGRGRLGGVDVGAHTGTAPATSLVPRSTQDPDDVPLAGPREIKRVGHTARGALDDRHWSEKPLSEMRERDWRIFREDFSIAARGGNIPHPLRSWRESNIPESILETIEKVGYKEPSAIQRQAIPIGMQNRDLIGVAETGSGKTAAFLIPMLDYIGRLPPLTDENRHMGPYALILAPTRELAQQIEAESTKFCEPLGYRTVSIVGGKAVEEQSHALRNGAEIIIATPGRLKDCIERHILVLEQCTYVIMDEADRMVAAGFEDVVNTILDALPVSNLKPDTDLAENPEKLKEGVEIGGVKQLYRETIMFSATMPPAVERIAKRYMRRPAVVTIGVAGQAVDRVEQRVEFIIGDDKRRQRLIEILNSEVYAPPIIVFVNQKRTADGLARELTRARWSVTTLHSDKNQQQREEALQALRDGEVDVLVATDLAGRGIDVQDVSLVVNYQMANTIEAYVHRIGRTGRAGKNGVAITFLSNDDAEVMYDLKQEISKSPASKVPPELARNEFAQTKFTREMRKQQENLQ